MSKVLKICHDRNHGEKESVTAQCCVDLLHGDDFKSVRGFQVVDKLVDESDP
jgi:hypothetical protein